MHYKISSLILNASKYQTGSRDVFVAQPDSTKENLAGRLFMLAEIDGKKADVKRVIDFIIESLDEFYYNDEKIFLRDKIEGLTLDNIFEAALAKLNKALLDFLNSEKIVLRAEDTNLVLGLIFENKLFFSNFGRNQAFLIHKHKDSYEFINVETSATEKDQNEEASGPIVPKFFSSVISGEITNSSYFLFCNEALPEYLSNNDLINIITKLPPMVAAEQIKNSLAKLNSYVPFLGIIIKNTVGLNDSELRDEENLDTSPSAHNSISNLNYTEKKTEQMLAPVGLINWKEITKFWHKAKPKSAITNKAVIDKNDNSKINSATASLKNQKTISAARTIKEKMVFGRSHSKFLASFKTVAATIINLFNPSFWGRLIKQLILWLKSLHTRNKIMFILFLLVFVVLALSLLLTSIHNRRQVNIEHFNNLIKSLETKRSMIDSYILYNNREGAKSLIGESLVTLDELSVQDDEQIARRDALRLEIERQKAQLQKLTTIDNPEALGNFKDYNPSVETRNILLLDEQVYAADPNAKAVYTLNTNDFKIDSFLLNGDFSSLDRPVNEANIIYYLSANNLVSLNTENGNNDVLQLSGIASDDKISAFQFYRSALYLMMADQDQVYKLSKNNSGFGSKVARLNEDAYLGDAVDLAVTGEIIFLKSNGQIERFYNGAKKDFNLESVDPSLDSASLFKVVNEQFFIFDKSSQRILIFNDQGNLMKQFSFPSLNNMKDFAVSPDAKNIYILNDDTVYQVVVE